MVACPNGSSIQPGAVQLIAVSDILITLFGSAAPAYLWPFIALAIYLEINIPAMCSSPPADITDFPSDQDFCDLGITTGASVVGPCTGSDVGRAAGRFVQWLQNQAFPTFCYCNALAPSATCGTFGPVGITATFHYNQRNIFAYVPRPAGCNQQNYSVSWASTQALNQAVNYREVTVVGGVVSYGSWTNIYSCLISGTCAGNFNGTAWGAPHVNVVGVQFSTFSSASSFVPTTEPVTLTVTCIVGTCTSQYQTITPGTPQQPVINITPPALNTSCTTADQCTMLTEILFLLHNLNITIPRAPAPPVIMPPTRVVDLSPVLTAIAGVDTDVNLIRSADVPALVGDIAAVDALATTINTTVSNDYTVDQNVQTLVQPLALRRALMPHYTTGAPVTGLTGVGTFGVGGSPPWVGLLVHLTAKPAHDRELEGNPPYLWDMGWISIANGDGMLEEKRVTRDWFVWLPYAMPLATAFNHFLKADVEMAIYPLVSA